MSCFDVISLLYLTKANKNILFYVSLVISVVIWVLAWIKCLVFKRYIQRRMSSYCLSHILEVVTLDERHTKHLIFLFHICEPFWHSLFWHFAYFYLGFGSRFCGGNMVGEVCWNFLNIVDLWLPGQYLQIPQMWNRDKAIHVFLKGSVMGSHLLSETHLSQRSFKTGKIHIIKIITVIFKLELRYLDCTILPLQYIFLNSTWLCA